MAHYSAPGHHRTLAHYYSCVCTEGGPSGCDILQIRCLRTEGGTAREGGELYFFYSVLFFTPESSFTNGWVYRSVKSCRSEDNFKTENNYYLVNDTQGRRGSGCADGNSPQTPNYLEFS